MTNLNIYSKEQIDTMIGGYLTKTAINSDDVNIGSDIDLNTVQDGDLVFLNITFNNVIYSMNFYISGTNATTIYNDGTVIFTLTYGTSVYSININSGDLTGATVTGAYLR